MATHEGAMIALTVPDPENYAIPVQDENTTPPEELHITLAYLGDAAEIGPEERTAILDACQVLADTIDAPESLFPASTGMFPPDPENPSSDSTPLAPFYAAPSNPEIYDDVRNDLITHLSARGVGHFVSQKFPHFSPHVTLAYAPVDQAPDLSYMPTPLPTKFSTLICKFADETHEFSLASPVDGPPLPLTASVRSQISRLSTRFETSEDYITALYLRQRNVKATPAQTRAQAAMCRVNSLIDPNYRSTAFNRVQTLTERISLESDPASKALVAGRALALASRTNVVSPIEARELAAMTASLRAIIADGNSSAARSLRARRQLRDRYGRWIEMGGGVRFKIRVPGAPGGGEWKHGTVKGFDMDNSRVNVELEDGRTVAIPNSKIEQPKAILGLKVKAALDKAKTFLPKSANRSNPTLPQPLRKADPETEKLNQAAMDALDNIYNASKDQAEKNPTGGHLVRLAIDASNNPDYDPNADSMYHTGTAAPFKGENIQLSTADVNAVRAAYDNHIAKFNKPAEGASEEEIKKALQKAQTSAFGFLSGLYNDKGDDDTKELRMAPAVGTDDELEEVTPDAVQADQSPDQPEDIVSATRDAFQELLKRVPDDSPLSGARDRIESALDSANDRFQNGDDDLPTYLKNLDSIKEYANDQEPAFKAPDAPVNEAEEAFGAFAEDIDDIHASQQGVDEIDAVRSALDGVNSTIEDIKANPGKYTNTYVDDLQGAVNDVNEGISSGKYLNNVSALGDDLDTVISEMEDIDLETSAEYEAVQLARKPFGGVSEAPQEPESVPDTTPESPSSDWTPLTVDDIAKMNPDEGWTYDDGYGVAPPGYDIPLPDGNHVYLTRHQIPANDNYGKGGTYHARLMSGPGTPTIDAKTFKYDESPYGSANGAMTMKQAQQQLADWINEKVSTPEAPESDVTPDLDTPEDYTDAPDGANSGVVYAYNKFADVLGAVFDISMDENGAILPNNQETSDAILNLNKAAMDWEDKYANVDEATQKKLTDDLYNTVTATAEALGKDPAYDSSKIQALVDAATELKTTYGSPDSAEEVAPEAVDTPGGENTPGMSDFSDLYEKFNDFLSPYAEDEGMVDEYDRAAAAANVVSNVGLDLQQGKIDASEGAEILGGAVADISEMLDADEELSDSDFGYDLDSMMGEVARLQARLTSDGFNPDEDEAPAPVVPEVPEEEDSLPSDGTFSTLTPGDRAALDVVSDENTEWLEDKYNLLMDINEAGAISDDVVGDFLSLQNEFNDAYTAYKNGETTHQEFIDQMQAASDKWMTSAGFGFLENAGEDNDGSFSLQFDTDPLVAKMAANLPVEHESKNEAPTTPSVSDQDPWAAIPSPTTPPVAEFPLAEWEEALMATLDEQNDIISEDTDLVADNIPEAAPPLEHLKSALMQAIESGDTILMDEVSPQKDTEEDVEDIIDSANTYLDALESAPTADPDAAAVAEVQKEKVENLIENLESEMVNAPIKEDAPADPSKLQGIIDALNDQDGFIQKILAAELQKKLDNGETVTPAELDQVQAFLGNIADAGDTTPEEKADYELTKDALDLDNAVPSGTVDEPQEEAEDGSDTGAGGDVLPPNGKVPGGSDGSGAGDGPGDGLYLVGEDGVARNVVPLAVHDTPAERVQALQDANLPTPQFYELDAAKDADVFRAAIASLKQNNKYAAAVHVYDLEDYQGMRLFVTDDGKLGFALNGDDIISAFSLKDGKYKGGIRAGIALAVANGGRRADSFDTILPHIYTQEGLEVVSRVKWDDNEAPDDWDKEVFAAWNNGEPDVVMYAYNADRLDTKYEPGEGELFDSWDDAAVAQSAAAGGTPEAPEAPETPATLEESIAAWQTSLSDYLASPAFTGADPSAAMVHGSVHNPLNQKQVENIQSMIDGYGPGGLSAKDAKALQKSLDAHLKGDISDDELIQAISSIGDNYPFYSKIAGRLRGAQSGIQVNKPALVGVLRPKEEYYGNIDTLDDTDFYMASPEVVQATLNKILEQSLAGADLEALLEAEKAHSSDTNVAEYIDAAKTYVTTALDALQSGNAEFMIANMRDALNEFDKAIEARKGVHKNDKVIRRLRARRRSLDEVLAAFEGRWPDPVVGGNKQEKHGGFIINNSHSMEDKEGNLVYPGDIIERTYGSAKGQLALTVATQNVNGVPRALVQLDDHPDVYHNGLGNKSFVLSAVGPNNPLYNDPSYTGPKVDTSPGTFGDLASVQKKYSDNQAKKGKGKPASTPAPVEPTPEAPTPTSAPDSLVTEAGGHAVGDTVLFPAPDGYGNMSGKIINFDSVGTEYEAATVETQSGDLHLVPLKDIVSSDAGEGLPEGKNLMDDTDIDPEDALKDLPVGSEVKTPSYVAGLDYMTWTKQDNGYWKGQYDTTSSEGIATNDWVVVSSTPDEDMGDDYEPFVFDAPTNVAEIMALPDLDAVNEYEGRVGDAFDNDEITESQYNALMGLLNERRDQLNNPSDGDGTPVADDSAAPSAPKVDGSADFVDFQDKFYAIMETTEYDEESYLNLGDAVLDQLSGLVEKIQDAAGSPKSDITEEEAEQLITKIESAKVALFEGQTPASVLDTVDSESTKSILPDEYLTPPPGSKIIAQSSQYSIDNNMQEGPAGAVDYAVLHPDGAFYLYAKGGFYTPFAYVTPETIAESEYWDLVAPTDTPTDAPADTPTSVSPSITGVKTHDISSWTQGKGVGGSNGATLYTTPDGDKYVVKPVSGPNFTPSQHTADMEALGSIIYNELGIKAPEIGFTTLPNGNPAVVSKFIDYTPYGSLSADQKAAAKQKMYENYAIDTWLANYDIIGLGQENFGVDGEGNLVYVDNGGAFDVKAQGDVKAWWGIEAKDYDMWSSGTKPSQSQAWNATTPFYKDITDEQKKESAKKLQSISDQDIFKMVDKIPTMSLLDKQKLAQTLSARRDSILTKAGLDLTANDAPSQVAPTTSANLDKFGTPLNVGDSVVRKAKTTGKVFHGTVIKATDKSWLVEYTNEQGQKKTTKISPEKWTKIDTSTDVSDGHNFSAAEMNALTPDMFVVHNESDQSSPWYGKPMPEKPVSQYVSTLDNAVQLLGQDWYDEAEKQYHSYLTDAGKPIKPLNTSASWHHYDNVMKHGLEVSLNKLHDKNKISDALYQQALDAIEARDKKIAAEADELLSKLAVWKQDMAEWNAAQGSPMLKLPTTDDLGVVGTQTMSESIGLAKKVVTPTSDPNWHVISSQKGSSDHNSTDGARKVLKPGDNLGIDSIVANPSINSMSKNSLVGSDNLVKSGKYVVPNGEILRGARTNTFSSFRKKDGTIATKASDFDEMVGSFQFDAGLMEMSVGDPDKAGYAYEVSTQVVMNVHALPGVSGSYTPPNGSYVKERGFVFHGPVVYLVTGVKKGSKYSYNPGFSSPNSSYKKEFGVELEVVVIPQSLYEQFNHFEDIDWVNNPPVMPEGYSGPTNVPSAPDNIPSGPTNVPGAPTNVPQV